MSVWRVPLAYTFLGAGFAGTTLFAQVYRYRQVSSPAQRQQTKWVVFGLAMALGGASVVALLDLVVPQDVLASLVGTISFYFFTLLIPLSIAVAVLRYHLYDIDTLINRTLVYGSVTAALVALYFVVIVVLQRGFVAEPRANPAPQADRLAALYAPECVEGASRELPRLEAALCEHEE